MDKYREIEKSIIKTYRKKIWSKFIRAIKEFNLVEEKDKICICISGGKDSMLLAKCFQELHRHSKINFDLCFIVMDPGYSKKNLDKIKDNLKLLNIDALIYQTEIFKISNKTTSPCYMCARQRRGSLYAKAQKLGCNKIALGHHFDDVIETILLNIFYAGIYKTMMPKLKSSHFKNMELIRPMYYIKEIDIISWVKYNQLSFIDCACDITKKDLGKRKQIKSLIKTLNNDFENCDINILRSSYNVDLGAIIEYKERDKKINFLDKY